MSRRTEIQVGATVLIALAILLWGVTWPVRFEQTGGLGRSDEVQVNGIRKGAVQDMTLAGDHVLVTLALAHEVRLTHDCRVAIRNVGMMGEKVIFVDLRETGAPWTERDTIPGIYERGIPEVISALGDIVAPVARLTEQLRTVADVMEKNGDFAGTVRNFKATSEELRAAVHENRVTLRATMENFSSASKTAKSLTSDREAQLKKTMEDFASAAGKLDRLAGRLDSLRAVMQSLSSKVDRGEGTLGKLVNEDKLYTDLSAMVKDLNALIADIKANPKKYLKVEIF
jgi:phospholipid/cholesterol/gamma-HCH transport system substrate-binding protein